ncbi:uncharacterized protein tp53i13 [Salarias fasciatus]|uniref:Tumor protein p53-inducible protein 13 n=1 Tax=Salarias fasciatus TaxID=181472 RepID=A0A672IMI9_SALFA|nr:tumor protein p53-inducible protein 13 [Salarias fasciatus]
MGFDAMPARATSRRGTVALTRPGPASSYRGTVALLAALWLTLGRCEFPRCDNGKLNLEKDLSPDAVSWDCAESSQRLPSIDSVYDPEPARQICMDKPIHYNHSLPSSGAYRPVMAESGEYLYCPPQRWLNNLHHGATVLLYHPCAPRRERFLLSGLARSCLPDFIMTPHQHLSELTPIALVSWGRTLELPTIASSGVCDWLAMTQTTRNALDGVTQNMKYNLLLTWSASLHPPTERKGSLKECCEETMLSLLSGSKTEGSNQMEGGRSRLTRAAAAGENLESVEKKSEGFNARNHSNDVISNAGETFPRRAGDAKNSSSTPASLSDLQSPKKTPLPTIQNKSQGVSARTTSPLASNISATTLRTGSSGLGTFQSFLQTAAVQPGPEQADLRKPHTSAGAHSLTNSLKHEENQTARPGYEGTSSIRHRGKDSNEHSTKLNHSNEKAFDKDHTADPTMKDHEVVDVKEREVEHRQIHRPPHSHQQAPHTDADSQPQRRPQSESRGQTGSGDCDGCRAGEPCDCTHGPGLTRLQRTPRTDEAVWAAAALGFLLILLTLSVLHTRLYRHWRTTPSLYWRDPQQDYDSVADVIRRRLRIAKRRRKRSRRQECVLLPSSSSSDEHA